MSELNVNNRCHWCDEYIKELEVVSPHLKNITVKTCKSLDCQAKLTK